MDGGIRPKHAPIEPQCARHGRGRWFGVALALVAWASVPARAMDPCPTPDVWVASTRRLPGTCRPPAWACPDVERLSGGDHGRWQRASLDDLLAEPDLPLVVFVHGNRYEAADAKREGVWLARNMAAACPAAGPVRTVIFSWPSEQQGVFIRDVRAKYERSHADGHYLGALLRRVEPERPVAIVGYSFGAIISLEALHDLAVADRGGGADVAPWNGRPGRTHLVLVAPAVRADALAPCGPYRATLAGLDRLVLVVNSADRPLAFFDFVDRCIGAEALGAIGMPRRWLPADLEYGTEDAAEIVGRHHSLSAYLAATPLARRIAAGTVGGLREAPADMELQGDAP